MLALHRLHGIATEFEGSAPSYCDAVLPFAVRQSQSENAPRIPILNAFNGKNLGRLRRDFRALYANRGDSAPAASSPAMTTPGQ